MQCGECKCLTESVGMVGSFSGSIWSVEVAYMFGFDVGRVLDKFPNSSWQFFV